MRITQEVVKAAHAVGVSVEAELGAIYGVEDGISHSRDNLVAGCLNVPVECKWS